MMTFFSTILAVANAVPIIDKWIQQFLTLYFQQKIASMQAADLAAIKTALDQHDQRDLEKQLGDKNAGEPSGIPGTHIVDSLPGVPKSSN